MPGPAVLVANVAGKGATESLGFIIDAESGVSARFSTVTTDTRRTLRKVFMPGLRFLSRKGSARS